MLNGRIVKGIGGFYYVKVDDAVYECKARGIFRKNKITPLVNDLVQITVNENAENTIDVIQNRKNSLVRPPIANLDQLFIVSSIVDPVINTVVLDRLIAIAEYKDIEPIIVITKCDLDNGYKKYYDLYKSCGFKVIKCNSLTGEGVEEVTSLLSGKSSAFTGNTGVGKSTLLNSIDPCLNLATGQTSKKLGRGKHTTRQCEMFKVADGYVADTPGFSAVDFERCQFISKEELPYCFREFLPYLEHCKFQTNCSHIADKGCAVVQALNNGEIQKSRHESYVTLYNEVKDVKEWEINR